MKLKASLFKVSSLVLLARFVSLCLYFMHTVCAYMLRYQQIMVMMMVKWRNTL